MLKWLIGALLAVLVTSAYAGPVTPDTITPIWFPHGVTAGGGGGTCSNDGSSGAPVGVINPATATIGSFTHNPTCKFPNTTGGGGGYGVGTSGLTAQFQTTGTTSTSSAVLQVSAPAGTANGQDVVDITNSAAITAGTTVSSFTGGGNITMSANAAATVQSGDIIMLLTSIDNTAAPSGCSKNNSTHQVTCSSGTPSFTDVDFSPDGGWKVICSGGSITLTGNYFRTGSNGYDSLLFNSSCAGATLSGNTFDGAKTNNTDNNALVTMEAGGTYSFSYDRYLNAATDFIDIEMNSNATITMQYEAFENNAQETPGPHPDWIQGFPGSGATINITLKHLTFVASNTPNGTRGITFGDTSFSSVIPNPVLTDSLFYLPQTGTSGNTLQQILGGDLNQITGTVSFTNNFVLPNYASFGAIYGFSNSTATVTSSGNINISSGATCNGPAFSQC